MKAGSFGAAYRSFAYLSYRRYRKGYILGSAGLLIGIGVSWLVLARSNSSDLKADSAAFYFGFLAAWIFFSLATNSNTVFQSATSSTVAQLADPTYPRTRRSLPVNEATLFLAPIAWGATPGLAIWLLFTVTVLLPFGVPLPTYLPPLFLVACVTSFHAYGWLISGDFRAGGRFILEIAGYFALLTYAIANHISEPTLGLLSATQIVLGLYLGLQGMEKGRSGSPQISPHALSAGTNNVPGLPLIISRPNNCTSPYRSTLWVLERQSGRIGCLVVGLALVAIMFGRVALSANTIGVHLGIGEIRVGEVTRQTFFLLLCLVPLASIMAATIYTNVLMPAVQGSQPVLRQSYSTRPIASAELSRCLAMQSARMLWSVAVPLAVGFMLWLLLPGQDGTKSGTVGGLLIEHATPRGIALLVLTTSLFFLASYGLTLGTPLQYPAKNPVARLLRQTPVPFLFFPVIFGLVFPPRHGHEPSLANFQESMWILVPLIGAWFAIRAVLLVVGISKVRREKLMETRSLVLGGALWAVVLAAFASAFYFLQIGLPFGVTAMLIALVLPLNRLIWPVLNIDGARHA